MRKGSQLTPSTTSDRVLAKMTAHEVTWKRGPTIMIGDLSGEVATNKAPFGAPTRTQHPGHLASLTKSRREAPHRQQGDDRGNEPREEKLDTWKVEQERREARC